jgi:hypothetical protein
MATQLGSWRKHAGRASDQSKAASEAASEARNESRRFSELYFQTEMVFGASCRTKAARKGGRS